MPDIYISERMANTANIILLSLTTLLSLLRLVLDIHTSRRVHYDSMLIMLAFASYVVMSAIYLDINSFLFKMCDFLLERAALSPTFFDEFTPAMMKLFACTNILHVLLYSVKFSILALARPLLSRVACRKLWWQANVAACTIAFILTILSSVFSCGWKTDDLWTLSACISNEAKRGSYISLYLNYALDVTTDVSIMLLLLSLLHNLQINMRRKIGLGILFSLGSVCIVAATVRVIQVGSTGSTTSWFLPTWLEYWSLLESALAIWVGAAPGIYSGINKLRERRPTFASSDSEAQMMKKSQLPSQSTRCESRTCNWRDQAEDCTPARPGILVTRDIFQEEEEWKEHVAIASDPTPWFDGRYELSEHRQSAYVAIA